MAWTITDGTNTYSISTGSFIKRSLKAYDYAEIETTGKFTLDTYVIIKEGATEIFWGYVKAIEEKHTGTWFKLTVSERAIELKDIEVVSGTNHNFVVNSQSVSSLVSLILTGTGWTAGTTDATVVDTIAFYYLNAGDALQKVIEEMNNKNIWFDNKNKIVYWGTQNHDLTATALSYNKKVETSNSVRRNINYVRVLGNNDTYSGSSGTGTKGVTYRYTNAKSNDECNSMAATILDNLANPKLRYDVTLKPNYSIDVCDLVKIDGTNYTVYDVKLSQTQCVIGVNGYGDDVFSIYGKALTEVSGEIITGSDATWGGNSQNVAANGAKWTEYSFTCKDKSMISNFILKSEIDNFQVSTGVAATTEYLSEVSQVVDTSTTAANTGLSDYITYFPSSSGIACSTMNNGFQFGMATITGTFRNTSTNTLVSISIQTQYKVGNGSWGFVGDPFLLSLPFNTSGAVISPFSLSSLFSGISDNSQLYIRWIVGVNYINYIYCNDNVSMSVQRIPRHVHSVTTTYNNTNGTNTPASSVIVKYGSSGTEHTLADNATYDFSSEIAAGATSGGIFYVKTPPGATNQCSVKLSASYQTLGKS